MTLVILIKTPRSRFVFLDTHVVEVYKKTKTLIVMYFYKVHVHFILYLSISTSFSLSSVYFERKTNLQFKRETSIVPVFARSLSECAIQCVFRTNCVSFFYNNVDLICPSEGKIYVSFANGNGNNWIYYGKN